MADVKSLSLGSVVVTAVAAGVVLWRRSQAATLGAGTVPAAATPLVVKLVFSALSLVSGVWIGTATT